MQTIKWTHEPVVTWLKQKQVDKGCTDESWGVWRCSSWWSGCLWISRWPGSSCEGSGYRADPPWGSGGCWRTESCRSEASAARGSSCSCGSPWPGPALLASACPCRGPPEAGLPVRLPVGAGGCTGSPSVKGHPGATPYPSYRWSRPCTSSTLGVPGCPPRRRPCCRRHRLPLLPLSGCGTESSGTGSSALDFPPDRWQLWLFPFLGLKLIQDWHSWRDCPALIPFSLYPLSSLLSHPLVHLRMPSLVYGDFLSHHH